MLWLRSPIIVSMFLTISLSYAVRAETLRTDLTVQITRFEHPPEIDGDLRDTSWQTAAVLQDFYQTHPGDNTVPSYPTKVLIGYDANSLYIGVHAQGDPKQIRATMAKRDTITNDDYIAIYLDTFHDHRTAYAILLNPFGIQQDGIVAEGKDADYSVDLVMESRGLLVGDGYTIELALPFRSIKYEAGAGKLWGIHVLRRLQAQDEENSWMPLRREKARLKKDANQEARVQFLAQSGDLDGISSIASTRAVDIIPAVTLSETGRRVRSEQAEAARGDFIDPGAWHDQAVQSDPGLTARVRLTPSISLDAAINPEFGEVEADQPQITANQRFPLFFAEKRPFFLEGIDLFLTPLQAVHTRTIIDPDIAVKVSGKRGRTNFGMMLASDNAPGNFSDEEQADPDLLPEIQPLLDRNALQGVLRIRRDVGSQSTLGLTATTYNFVEQQNHAGGVDGHLSFSRALALDFQILGTRSRRFFYDPQTDQDVFRTGNGLGYSTEINRTGRHLSLQIAGQGFSPDYRADLGFTQRVNTNVWSVFARYNSEPRIDSTFISWSFLFTSLAQFDWQGRTQYAYNYPRLFLNFKRQTFLNLYVYRDYLRIFEEEFGAARGPGRQGAFAGESERNTVYRGFTIEAGSSPSKKYSFHVTVDRSWDILDYDLGSGPGFPRVSPAALADPGAPLDPGPGTSLDIAASTSYQPSDALRISLQYNRSRLVRNDTRRVAFDQNLYSLSAHYYFTPFLFVRSRLDYDTMTAHVRGDILFGWTPNPGTALYIGYNDDLNYNGFDPFQSRPERGFHRNSRTFFIKLSYLLRSGF